MTREDDLASALRDALGCEFDIPDPAGAPLDYERVNVVYTDLEGEEHLVGWDAARACDGCANGWQYDDERTKVLLCGDACQQVRRAASIRIALGCRSVHVD